MFTQTVDLDGDERRLYARLHDEDTNPPALRRNLDHILPLIHQRLMQDHNTTTTDGSIVTCLMYMARDGVAGDDPMRRAIRDTITDLAREP